MGCHMGGTAAAVSTARALAAEETPLFGPLLPRIEERNTARIIEGTASTLMLKGAGYLVETADNKITTKVLLTPTDNNSSPIEIIPENVTFTSMDVPIPSTQEPGNYSVNAVNGSMASMPVNLVITPSVNINSVGCESNIITITGSGFGSHLNVTNSGTGVINIDPLEQCNIQSWTDTNIVADCDSSTAENIQINSIFGDASTSVDCETGRPDWWSLWSWFSSWGWSGR